MVTDRYMQSLRDEVGRSDSFRKTDEDLSKISLKNVKKVVSRIYNRGYIPKEMHQYLVPRYSGPGKLKGIPILYKEKAPLRTIASGLNTATERKAEHESNEFVESSPSFLRETTDFILKMRNIPEPLAENSVLFCFDVQKLYPSIPKIERLDAYREALERRTKCLVNSTDDMLMTTSASGTVIKHKAGKKCVSSNYCVEGVAIGSRLGKNFACSYMRKWDEKLLAANKIPIFYKWFIDISFDVWVGSFEELKILAEYANSIHPNIKVDLRFSTKSTEFLDTLVKLADGVISVLTYMWSPHSCHPPNTKTSLAYGLGLRIRRICEREDDYKKHRGALKTQLRRRAYSGAFIENQLQKVWKGLKAWKVWVVISFKWKQRSYRAPQVLTDSSLLPDVQEIV